MLGSQAPTVLPPHGLHPSTQPWPSFSPQQAFVQEVFSSIQGEGPYVGYRQLFVRFAHCHLQCAYCDTPMTTPSGHSHIQYWDPTIGQAQWHQAPNPWSPERLSELLAHWQAVAPHHSLSLTGGEPLLHAPFLAQWLPQVKAMGWVTYLETSGTQPGALAKVLPWVDVVAMDVKLPSSTQQAPLWAQHAAFYQMAVAAGKEVFIKCIVNQHTLPEELAQLQAMGVHPHTPIVLQPQMSLEHPSQPCISPAWALALQQGLSQAFAHVRVIAQGHKTLQVP